MRSILVLLCLALALPNAIRASEDKAPAVSPLDLETQALEKIDIDLRRGEWAAAEAAARARVGEALQKKTASLPAAVARLALAEAGQGHMEDALWHWGIAQNLEADFDPAPFGPSGERLAKSTLRSWDEAPAGLTVRRPDDGHGPLSPVRRLGGKNPEVAGIWQTYPKAIRVQVIVDKEGQPRQPVVAASTFGALTWAVLEALRTWSFAPARAGEEPVAGFYELSIPPEHQPLAELVNFKGGPLAEPEALLRAGRFEEADKKTGKVWRSTLNAAEQKRSFLGVALALKALAEAGRGEVDGAICRWQAAQSLEPRLYAADLSAYGTAGALLAAHPWGETLEVGKKGAAGKPGAPEDKDAKVTRPEVLKRPQPEYPEYAQDLGAHGSVLVAAVITKTGTLRNVVLETSMASSGLEASTLYSLCDWRFKPATFKGQPVLVYYTLTVNFQRGR
jgi:TonB family protein